METMHSSEKTFEVSDHEILDKYFKEVRRIKMLDQDEETELLERVHEGDAVALERLTKANLRFVIKIARQYRHYGVPLNDLISEGNIGLIKAIQQFNREKGNRLITYAIWWIKQYILKAISSESSFVNLPRHKYWEYQKIRKDLDRFEQTYQRQPDIDELAEFSHVDEEELNAYYHTPVTVKSISSLVNEDGEEVNMPDAFTCGNTLTEDLHAESMNNDLLKTLNKLSAPENEVVRLSFGIGGNNQMTLEEIAEETGMSKSRARRLRESAIRKLRRTTVNSNLRQYT